MNIKNDNIFLRGSILFIAVFVCGIGTFNQLSIAQSMRLSMIEMILCAIFILLSVLVFENHKLYIRENGRWMLPLIVIMVSGGLLGEFPTDYFMYFCLFVFFMVWATGKKLGSFLTLNRVLLLMSVIVAFSVLLDSLNPQFFEKIIYTLYPESIFSVLKLLQPNGYASGITIQPAYAAIYIAIGTGLFTSFKRGYKPILGKMIIVFMLITLFLTGKRAPCLGVFIAVCVVYFLSRKSYNKKILAAFEIFGVIFLIYYILLLYAKISTEQNGITRIILLINQIGSGGNLLSQRADLWDLSFLQFRKHPLFGNGWGSITNLTKDWSRTTNSLATHNIYIQLLAETGVVGTLLFMFPFVSEYIKNIICLLRKRGSFEIETQYIKFAVFWQTFFFIYGLTENPIYELCALCVFFISVIYGRTARMVE